MKAFAFDTTLAGRGYVHHIRVWQAAGYRVKLIFLQLDGPEEAIARVAQCVRVQWRFLKKNAFPINEIVGPAKGPEPA